MSSNTLSRRFAIALLAAASTCGHVAYANPTGGQIVAGNATIAAPNNQTVQVNQTTAKAIIDWRGFSIGQNEVTQFKQPDASAITLNRVTGGDPSQILGQLNANGQVWLINPNGIVFGKSARVDVAGLLATTLDIDNQKFLAGQYKFTSASNPSAMVINQGSITIRNAGLAALVAPGVENSGVIAANLGHIQLSSASAFTVDMYGDGLINFTLDGQAAKSLTRPDGTVPIAAVNNTGSLIADGGTVYLTANAARSVVDNAINMSGLVQASSVSNQNGLIVLDGGSQGNVQVAGNLTATGPDRGQTGGKIEVLGDTIHVASGSQINASGSYGGGRILIGGDFQGGNPNPTVQSLVGFTSEASPVRNANAVTIDAGTVIDASAGLTGNGGQIAVWSNGVTSVASTINANGGIVRGNGGVVETSGYHLASAGAVVNVNGGIGGKTGSWLLDPVFTIAGAGYQDTGVVIGAGDIIDLRSSGQITLDDDGDLSDPNEQAESLEPSLPFGQIVAKVGGGSPFVVPSGAVTRVTGTGPLFLGANTEIDAGGGVGSFTVDLLIVKHSSIDQAGDIYSSGIPKNAEIYYTNKGIPFYVPQGDDFTSEYLAGKSINGDAWAIQAFFANADIGQGGLYDYQRQNGIFYPAYTDSSNYGVGVYMYAAGYSLSETIAIGKLFATGMSSNSGSQSQVEYWTRGWQDAQSGKFGK